MDTIVKIMVIGGIAFIMYFAMAVLFKGQSVKPIFTMENEAGVHCVVDYMVERDNEIIVRCRPTDD